MSDGGFWDDLKFESDREDLKVPEWHPWDEKVFEDPANDPHVQESERA